MKKIGKILNKTLLIWSLRLLFVFSLIIFVLNFLKFFVAAYILTGLAGIAFIYLLLFFCFYKVEIRQNFLSIEKGVIFKTTLIIPYKKIVFVKCLKTPLLKAFGLSAIFIKTINGTIFVFEQGPQFISLLLQKQEEKEK